MTTENYATLYEFCKKNICMNVEFTMTNRRKISGNIIGITRDSVYLSMVKYSTDSHFFNEGVVMFKSVSTVNVMPTSIEVYNRNKELVASSKRFSRCPNCGSVYPFTTDGPFAIDEVTGLPSIICLECAKTLIGDRSN